MRHHGDTSIAVSSTSPDLPLGTCNVTSDPTVPMVISVIQGSSSTSSVKESASTPLHKAAPPHVTTTPALQLELVLDRYPDHPVTPPTATFGTSVLSLSLTPCTRGPLVGINPVASSISPAVPEQVVVSSSPAAPDATPSSPTSGILESWECVELGDEEMMDTEAEAAPIAEVDEEVHCMCGSSLDEGFMIQVGVGCCMLAPCNMVGQIC